MDQPVGEMMNDANQRRDDYGQEYRPSPRHLRPGRPERAGSILVVMGGVLLLIALVTGLAILLFTNID